VTFVHVTHDLEEAMMLADRICVMRSGEILQLGTPADIYYRPVDAFVAGFIGETNLLPVNVKARNGQGIFYESTDVADSDGRIADDLVCPDVRPGPANLMVRPELITVLKPQEKADCEIGAEVTEMFGKGGTVQYRALTPSGQPIVIEIPGTSSLPMQIGDKVRLGWAKKDIFVFPRNAA
jgi:ABC-type Fe3+/spermidine/putrescine transport system ATPase subunit